MKKKINKKQKIAYTDEDIGNFEIIPDFLPNPKKLALKEKTVKVTLSLTEESIDFFKKEAKENNTQYQKMIRNLLNEYAHIYGNNHNQPRAN